MNEANLEHSRPHHSSMLRRFGWFHKLLGLGRILKRLDLDKTSVQRVLNAQQAGPIVYVILQSSNVDYLALNHVLNERRLPLTVWANGLSHRWWEPWPDMLKGLINRIRKGREDQESRWISEQVQNGHALTVCLEPQRRKTKDYVDPLAAILTAQRNIERPIQLLPVVVTWTRAPQKNTNPAIRFLMDRTQIRSTIQQIANVVLRSRSAFVQIGDPVHLPELMERVPESRQKRALRIVLRRFLKRETSVIRGPRLISRKDMMHLVLDNPSIQEVARLEATATGQSLSSVHRKMKREFHQMAAHFRFWMIPVLDLVLRPMWTKVYSGVDIPAEDLERIRDAMRKGTVVLAPCHKSHFDYVLISWVFFDNKLIIPHVVAGANLALPVISWVLKSAGGFFIKRSFSGERLHPKIFAQYIIELTRQGYPLEFYVEGGRTRSGKFSAPKLGVLGMLMDAAAAKPFGQEITILPISIAYDRVAEQTAYARELSGANKTRESLGELAKATGVIRNRYGRVYIRVGDPISTSVITETATKTSPWKELSRYERGEILQFTGEQIIHRIGQVTMVLPTTLVAMGLLAHHRRGVTQTHLFERLHRFNTLLKRTPAPFAKTLDRFDEAMSISLSQFESQGLIESIPADGERIWSIAVNGRILLDYHKNHCLHLVMHAGLAAATVRGLRSDVFTQKECMSGFAALQWMLRKEFIFDPYVPVSAHLEKGLQQLNEYGAIEYSDEGFQVTDVTRISEVYSLFRSILEAYWLVLQTVGNKPRNTKDTIKWLHSQIDFHISSGHISRPEAVTEVNVKNAIKAFTEDGVFKTDPKERLQVTASDKKSVMSWLQPMVNE